MKKLFLLATVALALFSCGTDPDIGLPPTGTPINRADLLGTYNYTISGTASAELSVIGHMDVPINMDGTFEITADPGSEDGLIFTSKDFETTGRINGSMVEIDPFTRVSDTSDEYGESHISVTVTNENAQFEDGTLKWCANAEAEIAMTIMGAEVNGTGNGTVQCSATKQ